MIRHLGAGLLAAGLLTAPVIQAAESDATGDATLAEVTVTAQRVAENLQTTPISMTALSGSFIQKFDLNRVTSLETVTPNLVFFSGTGGSSSQVSAFIRGVGQFDFLLSTDPAVGLYVDGVYLARTFGTNLELNDIDRVEVLRGPQGTLFGKNNIGGAINITTLTPTGSGRTDFRASAGNYDSYALDLYRDQRITDDLALGISLMARRSDGWQDRPLGDNGGKEQREGGRATLSWTPSDTFSSRLSAEFTAQAQPSSPNVMIAYDPKAATVPFLSLFNGFVAPCCTPPTNIDQSGAEGPLVRDDLHGLAATWINDWKLDGIDLKSISAYRYSHADFGRDGDNSYVNYNGDVHNEHDTQITQEVQASGSVSRLKWVAGVYYLQERTRDQTNLVTAEGLFQALSQFSDPNSPLYQLYLARYLLDFNLAYDNRQTTKDYAVYLNGNYAFTDKLSLEFGGRFTHEDKYFSQFVENDVGTTIFLPVNPITGVVDTSNTSVPAKDCSSLQDVGRYFSCTTRANEFSPRVSINMQWTPDVFEYLQWSRGFRSGGVNGRPTSVADIDDYKPEHLDSTELGVKTMFFDHRLRWNNALFYDQYKDIQVLLTEGAAVLTQNAAAAKVYGLESDLQAAVTEHWVLQGSLGYMHNQYTDWHDSGGDYTWRKLQDAPEWTANLSSAYEWHVHSGAGVRFTTNVSFQSWMFLDAQNSPVLRAPSRTMVDAGLFYLPPSGNWDVGVEGKNLTDQRVLTSGYNGLSFFGYAEGTYTPPRRWWVTFHYHIR
ncbi:MAG TPA: TonB-dependent receptor [Steroidobacteraceae bacterium]|nr:TonB-dependent receptor [Steroidobacteraceae bacterium]